ncbi:GNAT family N-acetyltransferase [Enterovirga sp.]|uniref:GNAT family N-acetyltransferase n=1 Tax=Enterovirga sp. TaxID=2026350 RepID=UPI002BC88689|nr:GNAT family N-acetyltransferase [Enterovirga sp.]HMO30686.1 GNAT family N-acetyltransferase [Enterovirga sp.]
MSAVIEPATRLPIGAEVDATPAKRPEPGLVLEGRHVRLVPIDPAAHGSALYAGSHGPGREALWQYLFPAPFPDEGAFRAYLEKAAASADPFMLAILDRDSGEAVGHATYMRIEPAHRAIEVGNILYTPRLQRGPGGTEAMYLMARHAFEDLGYRRYEWKCNDLNGPSRRAAHRYGFTYEGTFRQHMIVKGRNRDTAWYAMLDGDWPSRRRAFELWLDPANFDGEGRQRLALSALNASTIPGLPLRRGGPADEAPFAAMHRAAYAWNREMLGMEPVPLQTAPGEILRRYETWLLDEAGTLAGAAALSPCPDHLEVWSLSVDPARQNAGIGRRLLEAAEARAKALGLSTLRLFTGKPLTKNIDWYRRRGYAEEREEELPDGRRLVHMVKTI